MPETEPKLKPCPFCGGEASDRTATEDDSRRTFFVQCASATSCHAFGPSRDTPRKAINAWNKRAK